MNCLLCEQKITQIPQFYELFLLKNTQKMICEKCELTFEKIPNQHCQRCYKANIDGVCRDCRLWEEHGIIIHHQAVFKYNAAMKAFFSHYKFAGDYRLRKIFQTYFTHFDTSWAVVPIPLSKKRYEERGFNQVSAFLEHTVFHDLLIKSESIQQSSLSRKERLKSKNAFSLIEKANLPSKVVLVDDIYTTGTTLQHAVKLLKNSGITDIRTFSLCR